MLTCPCCEEQAVKLSNPFTEKVWNLLRDLEETTILDCNICSNCFKELRNALIDVIED